MTNQNTRSCRSFKTSNVKELEKALRFIPDSKVKKKSTLTRSIEQELR